MKFSGLTDTDMKMFGQLINMIQSGEYSLNGKDLCASADTIRWLQKTVVSAAESYAASKKSPENPTPPAAPVAAAPLPEEPKAGFGDGVTVKAFNPGKMGKSK